MTAIVGESGCGKSTIVGLMNGNLIPQKGSVSVGNTKLGQLSRADYYSHLAVVSCNTYIFNDTVRNNFCLASPWATDEQMEAALKKVNLWKFIEENGGLDKSISEDAANISGGQKQRLCIARALLKKPKILILDDSTSAVDTKTSKVKRSL